MLIYRALNYVRDKSGNMGYNISIRRIHTSRTRIDLENQIRNIASLTPMIVAMFVIIVCGCSVTKTLKDGERPSNERFISRARFFQETRGDDVIITTRDGKEFVGELSLLSEDSLRLRFHESTSRDTAFSLRDVNMLEYRKHFMGVIEGFTLGTLGASLLASGAVAMTYSSSSGDNGGAYVVIFIAGAAILGGLVGAVIGGSIGHHERARVPPSPSDSSRTASGN